MPSGVISRFLRIKNFATWRKIPEDGNTLKDEALFIAKFQNKSTQPYDATNENLEFNHCFLHFLFNFGDSSTMSSNEYGGF